jgi:hypothetical protein
MYYSGIMEAWRLAGVCRKHCARGGERRGSNPVGTVVCGGYTGGGRTNKREVLAAWRLDLERKPMETSTDPICATR